MKLCFIQCYPYLSHARSRNLTWHLLWLSTTKNKNIVKLLAISHYCQWIVSTIKKGNDRYLWSGVKTFSPCAARTIIFPRENLIYLIVCFTRCTLCFRYVCFYCRFVCRALAVGRIVTRINVVSWHIARQTFASLGLFTFARIACLLQLWIKTGDFDYSIWATFFVQLGINKHF